MEGAIPMKVIIAVALLAAACGSTKEYEVGTATVTGSTNVDRASAIDRITTERCNRELSCGNIGPSRAWLDMASCRDTVRDDTKNFLRSDTGACHGVDYYDLAVCSNAIRNSECATGGMPRLAECDGAKICR
jgi:hypothetical protein